LVELLIAMALGLMLSLGVIQVFDSHRVSYRTQEALSQVQESARVAMAVLSRDIRLAGFWGCHGQSGQVESWIVSDAGDLMDYAGGGLAGADEQINGDYSALNGTDAITIRYAGSLNGGLIPQQAMANSGSALKVASGHKIPKDAPLVITDCHSTDIFANAAETTQQDGVILHEGISRAYGAEARIMRAQAMRYFIRRNPSNEPALYRYSAQTGQSLELVEGVEDMEIYYGADSSGDGAAVQYFAAGDAGLDMAQVVSVRIHLLVRSDDRVVDVSQAYQFAGEARVADDHRLRKAYTTTISLRNRAH